MSEYKPGMTASEIDSVKVEKEKELQQAQQNLSTVEIAELEISKQIIALQSKKKDLQITMSKAKQIVRSLTLEIRMLTSLFWSARDGR